jgi:hypothetical protein
MAKGFLRSEVKHTLWSCAPNRNKQRTARPSHACRSDRAVSSMWVLAAIACVHMTPLRASRLTFYDLEWRLCTNVLRTDGDASVMAL